MLRWKSGNTLRDKIRNERIRKKLEVAPIEDKCGRTDCDDQVRYKGNLWAPLRKSEKKSQFIELGRLKIGLKEYEQKQLKRTWEQ